MNIFQNIRRTVAIETKRYLARHRRSTAVRTAMRLCESLLDGYHNLNYSQEENGEFFLLCALASLPLSCFIDAGANIGEWTAEVKELFPSATVHSFEIHPQTFATLSKSTAGLSDVKILNMGLSDRSEDVELHCFEGQPGLTSAFNCPQPESFQHTTVQAKAIPGDSYISQENIDHVDFLKIDVEGMEDKVLRGFEETIRRGAIDMIQFEYGRVNILSRFLLRDFYEHLEMRGYAIGKIYPAYVDFRPYSMACEDFRGPNYVAVSKTKPAYIQLLGNYAAK